MKLFQRLLSSAALAAALTLPFTVAAQTPAPAADKTAKAPKAAKASAPSAADIADAKAKGLVWVNTGAGNKAYHKGESKYYGTTKSGKFMTVADAEKAGYHEAKNETPKAAKASPAATPAPTPTKK